MKILSAFYGSGAIAFCLLFQPLLAQAELSPDSIQSVLAQGVQIPASVPLNQHAEPASKSQNSGAWAPWPTQDWTTASPQSQSMDKPTLVSAFQYAVNEGSKAVIVTRNGYLIGEWYDPTWDRFTEQTGWSIAKSFSSALIGMLIDEGAINSLDDTVATYVPQWQDGIHDTITIRHLLSMTSGLRDGPLLLLKPNQTTYALAQPMDNPPDTEFFYNNTACQVLSAIIKEVTGVQAEQYARVRLWNRIGMWSANWRTDLVGNTLTYQSVLSNAREFAKFGYLYLRDGEWDGAQIVPQTFVAESHSPSTVQGLRNPIYGFLWWLNVGQLSLPDCPADAYMAAGFEEKRIYVVPSLNIVAVRLGDASSTWSDNEFLSRVCNSAN